MVALLFLSHQPRAAGAPQENEADSSARAESIPPQFFNDEVLPILRANCVRCHGPSVASRQLKLNTLQGVLDGSDSGAIVVPGSPDKSKLYQMVSQGLMPADKPGSVSSADVATIGRWIETVAASELAAGGDTAPVTENEVVALMWMHCTPCHGPHLQESGLDLRSRASMLQGGKSGPAIAPGSPDRSLIVEKIRAGEMPPPERYQEAGTPPVSKAGLEKLAAWIEQGAPAEETKPDIGPMESDPLVSDQDREFWAFQPPKRATPPSVAGSDLVRNPIDAFLLRKLEEKGLTLSPEADRFTLIRRAHLDLTGLPAGAGGGRTLSGRPRPESLREPDQPAARVTSLRRTVGALLARCGRLPGTSLRLALP